MAHLRQSLTSSPFFRLVSRFRNCENVITDDCQCVLSEVRRTWNRPEAAEIVKLYTIVAPNYGALIESYMKAQEMAKQPKK